MVLRDIVNQMRCLNARVVNHYFNGRNEFVAVGYLREAVSAAPLRTSIRIGDIAALNLDRGRPVIAASSAWTDDSGRRFTRMKAETT
ncbi:hypothetical protein AB1M95_16955 [Sulfitobacter sp. LCG007]